MRYFKEMNKFSISQDSLANLDRLIMEHQALFLSVPEYKGLWKPKHHFAQHVPVDIQRYGPPRHYWCMGFESYNQLIKNLAMMTNFKTPLVSVCNFWIAKSARNLQRGSTCTFSAGDVCVSSETTACSDAMQSSPLVAAVVPLVSQACAVRYVCSFTRDGDTVFEGSWLFCTPVQPPQAGEELQVLFGNVQEMAEIVSMRSAQLFVHLELRPIPPMDPNRGNAMWVSMDSWSSPGESCMVEISQWNFALAHVSFLAATREFIVQEVH